ncbi:MAG: C45 family autoproteolytic acyltransferase/hydrolase, partial [Planctomycetota bacterium]
MTRRFTAAIAVTMVLCFWAAVPATAQIQETVTREVIAREGKGRLEKQNGQLVLYVKGTPYEMGFQHGKLLRELVRKNTQAILDNKSELGRATEYRAYKLMRGLMHMRLRKHVPARMKEEMRGLAAGSGLSYDDVEASNLFPEAFHCSGMALFGKATQDGSLYHVRILDYMTMAGLQDMSVIVIHEPEGFNKWVNVGFAGFVGSVTGMNDKQITIGEMGGKGLFYWNGMPMSFLLRDALERASTLEEAVDIFRTTKRTCEYYYVISDGKSLDARGIWATPDDFEVAKPGEHYGFVTCEKPRGGAADGKSWLGKAKLEVGKHRILFKDKDEK